MRTHFFKTLFLFSIGIHSFSCASDNNDKTTSQRTEVEAKPTKTITGVVTDIQDGKDGYIATIATADATDYLALVSIPNVGGMGNYMRFNLTETVTLSGEYRKIGNDNHLTAKKIIDQKSAE